MKIEKLEIGTILEYAHMKVLVVGANLCYMDKCKMYNSGRQSATIVGIGIGKYYTGTISEEVGKLMTKMYDDGYLSVPLTAKSLKIIENTGIEKQQVRLWVQKIKMFLKAEDSPYKIDLGDIETITYQIEMIMKKRKEYLDYVEKKLRETPKPVPNLQVGRVYQNTVAYSDKRNYLVFVTDNKFLRFSTNMAKDFILSTHSKYNELEDLYIGKMPAAGWLDTGINIYNLEFNRKHVNRW